mmetsp:Transcript_23891/g.43387  ORF Transcript_23891/g.43387 Transcript_23891/m.43387 type:complete len:319 (-) Transcript_23891:459-1415(-)
MIRNDKAPVARAPAPNTPQGHPAAGKGGFLGPELARPGRAKGRRWGKHKRAGMILGVQIGIGQHGVRQANALVSDDPVGVFNGRVGQDRADRRVQHRQQPLRFAQGIAAQKRRLACRRAACPPIIDLTGHLVLGRPAKDGQAKGAFGDEMVALDRLERGREAIIDDFVIPRDDPNLARNLNPDLRRTGHMARRVKGHKRLTDLARLAIADRVQRNVAQPVPHDRSCNIRGEVSAHAGPRMIGVSVGDQRAIHRSPRVDIEITCGAIDASGGKGQRAHERKPSMWGGLSQPWRKRRPCCQRYWCESLGFPSALRARRLQ